MLMLFPDNAHFIFQLRFQGTKTKPAVSACIDDLVIAYGIAETFVYKKRGVIKQVVGGDDIQVRNFPVRSTESGCRPGDSCWERIRGTSFRSSGEIVSLSARTESLRIKNAPDLGMRCFQRIVLCQIDIAEYDAEVDQSAVPDIRIHKRRSRWKCGNECRDADFAVPGAALAITRTPSVSPVPI